MLVPLKLDRHLDVDAGLKPVQKSYPKRRFWFHFQFVFLEKPDILQSYTINTT